MGLVDPEKPPAKGIVLDFPVSGVHILAFSTRSFAFQ
jgi:hypothetical protein